MKERNIKVRDEICFIINYVPAVVAKWFRACVYSSRPSLEDPGSNPHLGFPICTLPVCLTSQQKTSQNLGVMFYAVRPTLGNQPWMVHIVEHVTADWKVWGSSPSHRPGIRLDQAIQVVEARDSDHVFGNQNCLSHLSTGQVW